MSLPAASEARRPASTGWRVITLRVLAILVVLGLSLFIFTIRDQARRLAMYGYPGIFLISLLANGTVLLPAPGIAVVFAMGSVLNPFYLALAAAAGAAIGEISGYLAGFSGQGVLEHFKMYTRIRGWMERYGPLTVFVLAAIPNPFFDLAGLSAGALKMPLWQFTFWCLLGKIIKMLFFAYTGAYSAHWIFQFLQ
jgi:membrane protein YqaA with SNARE-associated domain